MFLSVLATPCGNEWGKDIIAFFPGENCFLLMRKKQGVIDYFLLGSPSLMNQTVLTARVFC